MQELVDGRVEEAGIEGLAGVQVGRPRAEGAVHHGARGVHGREQTDRQVGELRLPLELVEHRQGPWQVYIEEHQRRPPLRDLGQDVGRLGHGHDQVAAGREAAAEVREGARVAVRDEHGALHVGVSHGPQPPRPLAWPLFTVRAQGFFLSTFRSVRAIRATLSSSPRSA